MDLAKAKRDVKSVYAAIVHRAIDDLKSEPQMCEEIYGFFKSDYGKGMLGVLGLDFSVIDEKFKIAEMVKTYRELMKAHTLGLNDSEMARHLNWEPEKVVCWRKKFKLAENIHI